MFQHLKGFTLIELLVALVILALLSLAGYRGLDAVLQTREHISQEAVKWQHLAVFFARLEQDVAQAIHRPARDTGGVVQPEWVGKTVLVADDEAHLTFTRAGMPDQGEAQRTPQRMGYRLEQGSILLLRWPFLDQATLKGKIKDVFPKLRGSGDPANF